MVNLIVSLISFAFNDIFVSTVITRVFRQVFRQSITLPPSAMIASVMVEFSLCSIEFSNNIEINPGPKHSSNQFFFICDWAITSKSAHNYSKNFLLIAYTLV